MYELAAADMERLAGWPAEAGSFAGPIRAPWPADRLAIELAIAPADARGRPLGDEDQRATVRRLIPWLARRLLPPAAGLRRQAFIVRADGRLQPGSLLEVFRHLDPTQSSLFSFSGASRLSPNDPLPAASAALLADAELLSALCADASLALEGGVRLRAMAVPAESAPIVLDCLSPDDDRWVDLLQQVSLFLGPSASMQSVFVVGPANAEELRRRLSVGDSR